MAAAKSSSLNNNNNNNNDGNHQHPHPPPPQRGGSGESTTSNNNKGTAAATNETNAKQQQQQSSAVVTATTTFPLSTTHRDACLRSMRLSKNDKDRIASIYFSLLLADTATTNDKADDNNKTTAAATDTGTGTAVTTTTTTKQKIGDDSSSHSEDDDGDDDDKQGVVDLRPTWVLGSFLLGRIVYAAAAAAKETVKDKQPTQQKSKTDSTEDSSSVVLLNNLVLDALRVQHLLTQGLQLPTTANFDDAKLDAAVAKSKQKQAKAKQKQQQKVEQQQQQKKATTTSVVDGTTTTTKDSSSPLKPTKEEELEGGTSDVAGKHSDSEPAAKVKQEDTKHEDDEEDDDEDEEMEPIIPPLSILSTAQAVSKRLSKIVGSSKKKTYPNWLKVKGDEATKRKDEEEEDDDETVFLERRYVMVQSILHSLIETTVVLVESWTDWGACWDALFSSPTSSSSSSLKKLQLQTPYVASSSTSFLSWTFSQRTSGTATPPSRSSPRSNQKQQLTSKSSTPQQKEEEMDIDDEIHPTTNDNHSTIDADDDNFFLHAIRERDTQDDTTTNPSIRLQQIVWKMACYRSHSIAAAAAAAKKNNKTSVVGNTMEIDDDDDGGKTKKEADDNNQQQSKSRQNTPTTTTSTQISSFPMPTRRERLLACCAALALVVGLHDIGSTTTTNETSDANSDTNAAPIAKRQRLDGDKTHAGSRDIASDAIDILLRAAQQEAAFTRWAALRSSPTTTSVSSSRIDPDLTLFEVQDQVTAIFNEVIPLVAKAAHHQPRVGRTNKPWQPTSAVSHKTLSGWKASLLNHLSHQNMSPLDILYYLPSAVDQLYNSTMVIVRNKHPYSPAVIPYIDEACLVDMDSLDTICARFQHRPSKRSDVAVAAGGTNKVPYQNEQLMSTLLDSPAFKKHATPISALSSPSLRCTPVTPPIITESIELNEWTVSLLYLELVKPSRKLHALLNAASQQEAVKTKSSGAGGVAVGGVGLHHLSQPPHHHQAQHVPLASWQNIICPILTRTILRLSQESLADKNTRIAPVTVDPFDGKVLVVGEFTPDKQLAKAVVALFYHALEAILYCEKVRRRGDEALNRIVFDEWFHKALLACCMQCALKAIGNTQKLRGHMATQHLQIYSVLHIADSNPYDHFKVIGSFLTALTSDTARNQLGSPLVFALPRVLVREVKDTEMKILDSLLWVQDHKFSNSLSEKIDEFRDKTKKNNGKTCFWPPQVLLEAGENTEKKEEDGKQQPKGAYPTPSAKEYADYRFISFVFRTILATAYKRISDICEYLDISPYLPVASQALKAFRYLVRDHTDLLRDRHVDHWILCCMYGLSKALKYTPDITFQRIIDAYVVTRGQEMGDVTCQRVVRQIKLKNADDAPMGNIITLYNKVFIPAMKNYLKSKSLKRATEELAEARRKQKLYPNVFVKFMSSTEVVGSALRGQLSGEKSGTQTILHFGKPQWEALAQANEVVSE